MTITHTDIWKFSIPMHPFRIATGTMDFAQNVFIRVHTSEGWYGVGECSAFPVITGETQNTCFEMARDFAAIWKNKDPLAIKERMGELHLFTAFNSTIKSAFDMALFDIASKNAGTPLYKFLGGNKKSMETDLTIGLDEPESMAKKAKEFIGNGVRIIKIKLGSDPQTDIERVKMIREAAGATAILRVDANQGWSYDQALTVLSEIAQYNIQFCEQPMRSWNDHLLPRLRTHSLVPLMADESVFDHHDAESLIATDACDFVNIKFAKSGGILEARRICEVCAKHEVPCMMGGMLESRVALTAFAHFATAHNQVIFYDMDTCMLGHKQDPVKGGVQYQSYFVNLPDDEGIGADADNNFLSHCYHTSV